MRKRLLGKYRRDEFTPYTMQTELDILGLATADPALTDEDVREALRQLVRTLKRSGDLSRPFGAADAQALSEAAGDPVGVAAMAGLVQALAEQGPLSVEDVIGVLGTIRSSARTWSQGPRSRGYLTFLARFFENMGIIVLPGEEEDLE
jgi:hypothetical protein